MARVIQGKPPTSAFFTHAARQGYGQEFTREELTRQAVILQPIHTYTFIHLFVQRVKPCARYRRCSCELGNWSLPSRLT
jgi:hypothetical protein